MITKRRLRRLACWWWGHNSASHYGYPHECMYCDALIDPLQVMGLRERLQFRWQYHRPAWLRLSHYRRCPDCGRRFGCHTKACNDIPF